MSILTEEQMTNLSPTALAVSKIKPGMKLTEVPLMDNFIHYPVNCHYR